MDRIPAESVVRRDWFNGMTISEMADRYGVSEAGLDRYLRPRIKSWQVCPAGGRPRGKIVCRMSVFTVRGGWREVPVSLPHLEMHERAMNSRLLTFRIHFIDARLKPVDADAIDAEHAMAMAAARRGVALDAIRKCSRLAKDETDDRHTHREDGQDAGAHERDRAGAGHAAERRRRAGRAEEERLRGAHLPVRRPARRADELRLECRAIVDDRGDEGGGHPAGEPVRPPAAAEALKPLCDMTIDELEAERRRWEMNCRRAPAWSAESATAEECRCGCETWLRYRREEEKG